MKTKKFLSFVLATAMVLGSVMTASATGGTAEDTTGTTVTGKGDVEYVDTKVYSVTLPTTDTLALTVDPQGLTGMIGTEATLEELDEYAGKVFMKSKPVISNRGSVTAKVTAELKLTGDATPVDSVEAVTSDEANNIFLCAVPSKVDVSGNAANYVASETEIALTTSGVTVDFILPGADYQVVSSGDAYDYKLVDPADPGHGTALDFTGWVNKNADWSKYTGTSPEKQIGMTAKFTFTHTLAADDVADDTEGAPYGMKRFVAGEAGEAAEAAPVFTASTTTPGLITYTNGGGELGIKEGSDLQIWHQYAGKWYNGSSQVTISAGEIQYDSASVTSFASKGDTFTVEITYINGKDESVKVRLDNVKAK